MEAANFIAELDAQWEELLLADIAKSLRRNLTQDCRMLSRDF